MTNVEKLANIGILGKIRRRLGASNDIDKSFDDEINGMSNTRLIGEYAAWQLGYADHWYSMKNLFDQLEEMDK
jgi:hypothetical protein